MKPTTLVLPNTELRLLNRVLAAVIAGIVCIGLYVSVWYWALGLLLVPVVLTKTTGVELDGSGRRFRNYNSLLGWRRGNWRSLGVLSCVVILRKSGSKTVSVYRTGQDYEVTGTYSELFLMDRYHAKRLFLANHEKDAVIRRLASEVEALLGMPLESYAPVLHG